MANFSFTPPHSSSLTSRVEKATSHLLSTPDWTLNIDICDAVNNDQGQAKDVVKTVKKRLQHKNPKVQFFTLTLLETLIKNCGDYVHFQVVERDILQDMIKIVKKGADMQVRDKALVLLDSWQEAFGGPGGKYPQYYWAYVELKRAGVMFPKRMIDTPPIFTPPATHPALTSNSVRLDEAMASDRGNLGLTDLNRIRNAMEVLADMLQAVNPNDRAAVKDEVITELVNQCRAHQKRLMEQLSSTGDEEILGQGLELNDGLQSLLAKHDAIASGAPLPIEAPRSPTEQKAPIEQPVVINQTEEEDEEDDEFAELARRKSKQVSSESTSLNSSDPLSPNHSDVTTASSSDASSSVASNALVPIDPPAPVRIHKEEQNMIDLMSLTLVTTSSPSASSQHDVSPSSGQDHVHPSQSYPVNQGYPPMYNDYVAPWAQPALPPPQPQPQPQPQPVVQQPSQYTNSYPVPPSTIPNANFNPPQNSYQYPAYANPSATNNFPGYAPTPQQYNPFGSGASNAPTVYQPEYTARPLQQYGAYGPGASYIPNSALYNDPSTAAVPVNQPNYASRPLQAYNSFSSRAAIVPTTVANQPINNNSALQKYNSFGARANSVPTPSIEQPVNSNAAPKPYYHPDSLFSDLIDLRSSGAAQKRSTLSSTSGQSMVGGRK